MKGYSGEKFPFFLSSSITKGRTSWRLQWGFRYSSGSTSDSIDSCIFSLNSSCMFFSVQLPGLFLISFSSLSYNYLDQSLYRRAYHSYLYGIIFAELYIGVRYCLHHGLDCGISKPLYFSGVPDVLFVFFSKGYSGIVVASLCSWSNFIVFYFDTGFLGFRSYEG